MGIFTRFFRVRDDDDSGYFYSTLNIQYPKFLAEPIDLLFIDDQPVLTLYLHFQFDVSIIEPVTLNLFNDPLLDLFIAHLFTVIRQRVSRDGAPSMVNTWLGLVRFSKVIRGPGYPHNAQHQAHFISLGYPLSGNLYFVRK